MNLKIVSFFLGVLSFFLSLFDLPTYPHGDRVDMSKFELVFSDEFDGDVLNTDVWNTSAGAGNTSVRRGGYWNTDMATLQDGNLHIATKYFPDGYKGGGPGWYSAELTTQKSFTQTKGYFEVRCILPKGYGMWSAFWLMGHGVGKIGNGGTDGAEIDIFESPNYCESKKLKHNSVSSNLHYDGYGDDHRQQNICRPYLYQNDPYEEFNTYALEWSDTEYIIYVNGVQAGRSDFGGISQDQEWLLLSVEVGGDNGVPAESWAGPSIETDPDAVTDFIVDYVRVYQYK